MPACPVNDSSAVVTTRLSRTMRPRRPSCGSSGVSRTPAATGRSAERGIRSLRDAESLEAVALDRIAAQEGVTLLGIHPCTLAEPVRDRPRVRPRPVTVRIVGLEENRPETD